MSDREWRDLVEQFQHERAGLVRTVAQLEGRVAALERRLSEAIADRERLAAEWVRMVGNPGDQTSDFGLEQAARLVEYLKRSR